MRDRCNNGGPYCLMAAFLGESMKIDGEGNFDMLNLFRSALLRNNLQNIALIHQFKIRNYEKV